MEKTSAEKDMALKEVLNGFIQSYAQRDTDMAFPDWLADRLRQELPGMEPEASVRLAGDIIGAIASYDQTLHELNQAIEKGQSKEEWLSEQLEKACEDMPVDVAGEALQRMEAELLSANMQLMGEADSPVAEEQPAVETEPVEWSEYGVRAKTYSIGQQLNSMALSATAGALGRKLIEEKTENGDAVASALKSGLKSEVKAVVAGAVRICAERGLEDTLPSDTPIEVIGDMAGVAVEGTEALYDAANGDISMKEAMDKVGRAGIAAGCRIGLGFLRGWIMTLPGGLLWTDLLGGLFDWLESSQFINNFYQVVRSAAVEAWEGIKKSHVGKTAGKLKRILFG